MAFIASSNQSSRHGLPSQRLGRAAVFVLVSSGLVGVTPLPAQSAPLPDFALKANDYQVCASQLLTAGIENDVAADACAEALHPHDLSRCVLRIEAGTEVLAEDALSGCKRVRRPLDMSSCVLNVDDDSQGTVPNEALDYCRRSLLPLEFSECVIGLRREIDYTPLTAMNICISADDRPVDYQSDYVQDRPVQYQPTFNYETDPSIQLEPFRVTE
jgi:hypothetical protein